MTRFMTETLNDIRRGRESWRVYVASCTSSFALTIFALTLEHLA